MKHVLILNGHQPYPFSTGRLNAALVERIRSHAERKGHEVRTTVVADGYDVDAEVDHHRWADLVVVQMPVNWMTVPWSLKKYMDEVYTAGMDGRLCTGDGRSRSDPERQYGQGGTLQGKEYLLSLTFNAPQNAFDDPDQYLFQGRSVDDLVFPLHMNFRFFGMTARPTFACHDVMKNPDVEGDFARLDAHLDGIL